MARGAHEIPRKNKFPIRGLILVLLLLAIGVGGVTAYLSASDGPLSNVFKVEDHPGLGVNPATADAEYKNRISVTVLDYAVYLRAAVVVNWVNANGDILAEMPVQGTDYSVTPDNEWVRLDDGFYYYTAVIEQAGEQYDPPVTISPVTAKDGYTLKMTIYAQTVQAVGTTDDGTKTAVEDAWGVAATEFIQPTQQS